MGTLITGIFVVIVFVVVVVGLLVYSTVSWGVVLFKFWGWFVLPVFVTLPTLTFVQALGLMFVIGLFHNQLATHEIKDEYKKNKNGQSLQFIIAPWITLLIGYLAYIIFVVPTLAG